MHAFTSVALCLVVTLTLKNFSAMRTHMENICAQSFIKIHLQSTETSCHGKKALTDNQQTGGWNANKRVASATDPMID